MLPAHYNKKETSYFCRFSFGQFFALLVIEIFTLFFVFYLGARYGDELLGTKPIAQTQQPQATAPGMPQLSITSEKMVTTTEDPEVKAMAKDILNSAQTPDLKKRVAAMLEESAANRMAAQGASLPPKSTPPPPKQVTLRTAPKEETPQESETPPPGTIEPVIPSEAAPQETARPTSVIQTAPHARYTIQVGSYPNVDEAHAITDQWKAKGYPAYLVSADIPNKGRWYRVRLGGFNSKEAAEDFNEKLTAKEQIEAFVVTNE
ncbi:MAG: hypothetical protein A3H42_01500 [Deltaproteobacteria bacterium RIFCSPLOWO2_02_FULL_46_8]|nr:MAG: hypothetical protein A3H42_01500 [Deltaproteobacteria bacterium RIFCSPLOWO2_02_FULL_46_8]